jgi:putative ABC transport system permease protein
MRPAPPERGGRVLLERIAPFWNHVSFRYRLVIRAIFRNPFRSGVNVLTAVLAMALLVSSFAMADGMNYLVEYQFGMISHEDLSVSLREPVGDAGSREVSNLPTVTTVESQLTIVSDLSVGHRRQRIGVVGLPRNNRLFTPLNLANEPIVIPETGLVLTDKAADLLGVGIGDTVSLRPLIGRRERVEAPIVGVVKSYLGISAYANIEYLSRLIGEDLVANSILATSSQAGRWDELYTEVKERPDVVGLSNRQRAIKQMQETFIQNIKVSITILILFAGLIAFGSVLNTALVSLSEREREVGTFRVLGYSSREIASILRGEQVILSALGIALGAGAGVGLTHLIAFAYDTDFMRLPVVIYPSRLAIAAGLMILFISLAQILVYGYIKRLPWLDALKVKE